MSDDTRDDKGRFAASGANSGEQGQRDRSRYAVRPHADQKSVGTHTGKLLGNLAKAALGTAAGIVGTIGRAALRNQPHGRR
jgi:hypothetical protein